MDLKPLFDIIPQSYFTDDLRKNQLGSIKIALLREVTGNLVIRNNYADEVNVFQIPGANKTAVEIPARKLKSREKMLGLKICRQYNAVGDKVRYNFVDDRNDLANPNSVLFGDSYTKEAIGLTSRVIYDWCYSLRDVQDITIATQHNATSEGGTMWDEEKGGTRQSLFQVPYVKPTTFFPHFVTFQNITPALLVHWLFCCLYENRYGAQSTTTGVNMRNHIVGVGLHTFEQPINSFSLSKNWNAESPVNFDSVKTAMETAMQSAYGEGFKDGASLVTFANNFWSKPEELKKFYADAQKSCEKYIKDIKIWKKKGNSGSGEEDDSNG